MLMRSPDRHGLSLTVDGEGGTQVLREDVGQLGRAVSQRPTTLPSGSVKYAAKPMSPTGVFPATVEPPMLPTRCRVSSMLPTSTTITGPAGDACVRGSMPPLM